MDMGSHSHQDCLTLGLGELKRDNLSTAGGGLSLCVADCGIIMYIELVKFRVTVKSREGAEKTILESLDKMHLPKNRESLQRYPGHG
jgi:hypothetical protein